jgi:hypothetical protein
MELQKGRESANKNQHKMMSFVQSGQHDTSSATGTAACVKKINDTLNVISQCNKQLANLRKKKRVSGNKNSLLKVNKQIKKKQRLIASLDAALDQHEMELNDATNLFAAKKSKREFCI